MSSWQVNGGETDTWAQQERTSFIVATIQGRFTAAMRFDKFPSDEPCRTWWSEATLRLSGQLGLVSFHAHAVPYLVGYLDIAS